MNVVGHFDDNVMVAHLRSCRHIMRETLTEKQTWEGPLEDFITDPDPDLTEKIGDRFCILVQVTRREKPRISAQ